MTMLALVAHSARVLAEAAQREGFSAIAVDLFGDADTRRASKRWLPAGEPGALQLDTGRVLATLRHLAARGGVAGWVAGGGCEGLPDLLAEGATVLPLIGTAPQAVRRVRDPLAFFNFLAAQGIAHPEVRASAPDDPQGWLLKDAHGCGGWHIRAAADMPRPKLGRHHYFQRVAAGTPMSATFCGNGQLAVVLGFNELIVRPLHGPFVYCGVIGPVPLPPAAARQAERAVQLLTQGMSLQGLGSLDFIFDGQGDIQVLEVNPRPPASMALYSGTFGAHVAACQHGHLPAARHGGVVRGQEVIFAPRALHLNTRVTARLHAQQHCHDLPAAGTQLRRGDPLCSVSAQGASAAQVRAALTAARSELEESLETPA